jgi:LPS O-antigen subunit length determinant protein (WzzB/FepE family)
MPSGLPPHFIDLVQDALLKSFWTKKALRNFLRRSRISENFFARIDHEDTKRMWLDSLFPTLEATERGHAVIQQMAMSLADQTTFPDLLNREDSAVKVGAAEVAITSLREYLARKDEDWESEKEIARKRQVAAERRQSALRSQADLAKLKDRLDGLCTRLGTQKAGYDFQEWFYDLMTYFDVDNRRPYVAAGRQIDGSTDL